MLVVIYETKFSSPFSILVSMVTASGYSHGAIVHNGVLYDTTMSRGKFSKGTKVDDKRKVAVVEIDGSCQAWLQAHIGSKYDWVGLLLWPLGLAVAGRMYCFNVVERALNSAGVQINLGWRKSGGSILSKLLDLGYPVEVMHGKDFNERYLKHDGIW
jgi:hypothetical protein